MKKNINLLLITALICFSAYTPRIFATTIVASREEIKMEEKSVYQRYKNLAISTETINWSTAGKIPINIDGTDYIGYCIDFGVTIHPGTSNEPTTLYSYFRNVLSDEEANALIKKITLYRKYGYGSPGRTTDKYYIATQKLIWEAISDSGFYDSDYYEGRAGKRVILADFEWTINKETVIDISEELSNIENSIKKHNEEYYKTPSFCSSQNEIEIEVGETIEYIDDNGVLSLYDVTCSEGITCQVDDDKLTVTSTDKTGNHQISFLKPETGEEDFVYRVEETQGIIIAQGGLFESVSCEFGIDTFKNEKTADTTMLYVITIGLFSGTMAYVIYCSKKNLEELK